MEPFKVLNIDDLGDRVICDFCGDEWTDRPESGGLLFGTKATCPDCEPGLNADIEKYGEGHYVRGRCPANKSFANWVREDLR